MGRSIKWERPVGPTGKPMTCETAWFTMNESQTEYSYGAYKFKPNPMTVQMEVMTKMVTLAAGTITTGWIQW